MCDSFWRICDVISDHKSKWQSQASLNWWTIELLRLLTEASGGLLREAVEWPSNLLQPVEGSTKKVSVELPLFGSSTERVSSPSLELPDSSYRFLHFPRIEVLLARVTWISLPYPGVNAVVGGNSYALRRKAELSCNP